MAKTAKPGEPISTAYDNRIPCELSAAQIEKAEKHLQARLRHVVLQAVFSTGEAGQVANIVRDIQALGMIRPTLNHAPERKGVKTVAPEDMAAEQKAAHAAHKADEERNDISR